MLFLCIIAALYFLVAVDQWSKDETTRLVNNFARLLQSESQSLPTEVVEVIALYGINSSQAKKVIAKHNLQGFYEYN